MKTKYLFPLLSFIYLFVMAKMLYDINSEISNRFENNQKIAFQIQEIKMDNYALNNEIFANSFFLFFNYDKLNDLIDKVQKDIDVLSNNSYFMEEFSTDSSQNMLQQLIDEFEYEKDEILYFQSYNSAVKNSLTYLSVLMKKTGEFFDTAEDKEYIRTVTDVLSMVFQAKNSMDMDMLHHYPQLYKKLSTFHFNDMQKDSINEQIMLHLNYFYINFTQYVIFQDRIFDSKIVSIVDSLKNSYINNSEQKALELKQQMKIFATLFVLSFFVIAYFIYRVFKNERESNLDPLTGVSNRRMFDARMDEEMHHANKTNLPLSMMILDIDFFKKVNDTYGHQVGDYVLKTFSHIVKHEIRKSDLLVRYGGEEFVVLSICSGLLDTVAKAEEIRKKVESYEFEHVKNVTVSIGVTQLHEDDTKESFMKRADDYLYVAKKRGRNCVISDADAHPDHFVI